MSDDSYSQNCFGNSILDSPVSSYSADQSTPSSSSSSPKSTFQPTALSHSTEEPFFPSATFNYYFHHYRPQNPSFSLASQSFRQRISRSALRPQFVPTASSSFAPAAHSTSTHQYPPPQPSARRPPVIEITSDFDEDNCFELLNPTPLATISITPPKPSPVPPAQTSESSFSKSSASERDLDCSSSSSFVALRYKSCVTRPFRKKVVEEMNKASQSQDPQRGGDNGEGRVDMSEAEKHDIYGDILVTISFRSISGDAREEERQAKVGQVNQPQRENVASMAEATDSRRREAQLSPHGSILAEAQLEGPSHESVVAEEHGPGYIWQLL